MKKRILILGENVYVFFDGKIKAYVKSYVSFTLGKSVMITSISNAELRERYDFCNICGIDIEEYKEGSLKKWHGVFLKNILSLEDGISMFTPLKFK